MPAPIFSAARSGLLVLQLAKLGDFMQTRAFLAALAASRPGEHPRILLLDRRVADLLPPSFQPPGFEIRPLGIENLEAAAKLKPWPLALAALEGELAPLLKTGFRAVYNLNTARLPALLARLTGAPELYGPLLRPDLQTFTPYPAQEIVLALRGRGQRRLGRFNLVDLWKSLLGANPPAPPAPAWLDPADNPQDSCWPALGLKPPARDKLTVGFQMGAAHPARGPGVGFLAALAQELARPIAGGKPLGRLALLGALGLEERLAFELTRLWPRPDLTVNLTGRTDLAALAGVLASLDLLITGDTGAMHLAAALKVPVLALFQGPAWAPETAPYAPGVVVHQALAPCGPCLEKNGCPNGEICLARPRPKIIAKAARQVLDDSGKSRQFPWTESGRFWRTSFDRFGLALRPWGSRPVMDLQELEALALREAGRAVMQPGYRTGPQELAGELAAYDLSQLKGLRPETSLAALKRMFPAAGFWARHSFERAFKRVFDAVATRQ